MIARCHTSPPIPARSSRRRAHSPLASPAPASYRELGATPPDEQLEHGSSTWWTRSQALLIGYSSACAGDDLAVDDVDGEYAVLVLDGAEASIEHATGSAIGDGAGSGDRAARFIDGAGHCTRHDHPRARRRNRSVVGCGFRQRRRLRHAGRQRGRASQRGRIHPTVIASASTRCPSTPSRAACWAASSAARR